MVVVFDTHRFVKRLVRAGFTERQAEALAEERVAALDRELATKAALAAVRANLLRWMIGAMVVQAAVIVALVRFP